MSFDKDYQPPDGSPPYSTWLCQCPHHPRCEKKRRVTDRHESRWGPMEEIAFLSAWRDTDARPGRTHAMTNPDDDRVAEAFHTPENVEGFRAVAAYFEYDC